MAAGLLAVALAVSVPTPRTAHRLRRSHLRICKARLEGLQELRASLQASRVWASGSAALPGLTVVTDVRPEAVHAHMAC